MKLDAWIVEEVTCCHNEYRMTVATEEEAKRVCEYDSDLRYYQQSIAPFTNVDEWIQKEERYK